jgi:hypothetical protein
MHAGFIPTPEQKSTCIDAMTIDEALEKIIDLITELEQDEMNPHTARYLRKEAIWYMSIRMQLQPVIVQKCRPT